MARPLRGLLLATILVAFAYLLLHAREPLRLNVGDPWSDANVLCSINYVKEYGFLETSFTDILDVGPLTADSYRYIHYPPFSEIFYGAVGKYLGVDDIGTFRLFALAWSALAMWCLFQYARRLYGERVALITTSLFCTSLLWLMYADSIHQAPVMQATGFFALWCLVRAIETGRRRFVIGAAAGSFACFFTSYDYWLFLPAAVLFTVYVKLGNPFARAHRGFVAVCALGCFLGVVAKCLAVIGAVGWDAFVADVHMQFLERATSTHDRQFSSALPTIIRRVTLVFTPLAWWTAGVLAWRALRAPRLSTALTETVAWMLVAAFLFLFLFRQLAASQMLASQVLLPCYAFGSAMLIDRLLEGTKVRRAIAVAWLVAAPVWSFSIMLAHPRSVLDRDDVAKVNAYLAEHDRNDFLMSNVLSDGHIQASFHRHYWPALADADPSDAHLLLLRLMNRTGTDYVHAAIFTTPDSRFIDKSLWPLAMPRQQWSVTGWPHLFRAKTNRMVAEYDRKILDNLRAAGAQVVLRLSNFDIYRVSRAEVEARAGARVPTARRIELGSLAAHRHLLDGWGQPWLAGTDRIPVATIIGAPECAVPAGVSGAQPARNTCPTVLTKFGMTIKGERHLPRARLLVRVDQRCDQRVRVTLAYPTALAISFNDVAVSPAVASKVLEATVPAASVRTGINTLGLQQDPAWRAIPALVEAVEIEPAC